MLRRNRIVKVALHSRLKTILIGKVQEITMKKVFAAVCATDLGQLQIRESLLPTNFWQ
jgi:hypothetical protein